MKGLRIPVVVLALLFLASPCPALSFDHVPPFEDVAKLSTLAFRGEIVAVRYASTLTPRSGEEVPFTAYTFQVHKAYRGTADGAQVTIFEYGGPVGTEGDSIFLMGLPPLTLGDHLAVFSNDSYQFLFATLYAEAGMRRFVMHQGQLITLTAGWAALAEGAQDLDELHQCQPDTSTRTACAAWVDAYDEIVDGPLSSSSGARLVPATAFDQRVAAIFAGTISTLPPQRHTEASYATRLGEYIEITSSPAPLIEDPAP